MMKVIKGILFLAVTAAIMVAGVLVPDMLVSAMMADSMGKTSHVDSANIQQYSDLYLENQSDLALSIEMNRMVMAGNVRKHRIEGMGIVLYDKYERGREKTLSFINRWNSDMRSQINSASGHEYYITDLGIRLAGMNFVSADGSVKGRLVYDFMAGLPVELTVNLESGDVVFPVNWESFVSEYSLSTNIVFTTDTMATVRNDNYEYYVARNYDRSLSLTYTFSKGSSPSIHILLS